jgi:hypothetical protein
MKYLTPFDSYVLIGKMDYNNDLVLFVLGGTP